MHRIVNISCTSYWRVVPKNPIWSTIRMIISIRTCWHIWSMDYFEGWKLPKILWKMDNYTLWKQLCCCPGMSLDKHENPMKCSKEALMTWGKISHNTIFLVFTLNPKSRCTFGQNTLIRTQNETTIKYRKKWTRTEKLPIWIYRWILLQLHYWSKGWKYS